MIELDGDSLTLEQLAAIADRFAPVRIAPRARAAVRAARDVVDRTARGDQPVYGINTGFGSLAEVPTCWQKASRESGRRRSIGSSIC
jgi:histidine ammonia-lyase